MATKKIDAEKIAAPTMAEDETATAIPGDSPSDVYAELEAIANGTSAPADARLPVDIADMPTAPSTREFNPRDHGGHVEGDHLHLGEKVFYADADKRKTVDNQMNMATGPRRTSMPKDGEFLPNTKSFRRVPYRTLNGAIRVDN